VRPIFWGLALAALLVLAGYLVLGSRQLQDRVARWAEERASALIERPVSIGELRFEVLPLTVELNDLEVGGREPDEEPLGSVPHVTVDAQLFWRGGWRLELRSVRLDEPVINLIFDPGQGSNVAQLGANLPRRDAPRRGSFQFALEELTIHRGTLVIDHQRLPLDLSARGLAGRFWGTDEPQFEVEVRELETTLPQARPYLGAASVRGRLDWLNLEILQGRIEGPDISIATTGRFRFGEDRGGALELAVETGSEFLRRVGYVGHQLAGEFDFGGTVFWDAEGWEVQGAMASRALRMLNFPLQRVQGVFNGNREQLELEIQHAEYADGALTGIVAVDLDPSRPPVVVVDLNLDEVDFELLLAGQGWPVAGVSSRVSGPFSYGFNWPQPDRGAGWANLRVTGRRGGVAFNGTVPLLIQGGVFHSKATRLISASHRLEASGFYDLEAGTGEFDFRVATERADQLLPLLDLAGDPTDLWRPTAGRGEVAGELTVEPAGTRVGLRLDLAEVTAPGASADQLRGALGIDGEGIRTMRLELLRPDAGLIVTGRVPFAEPVEDGAGGFVLNLDAAGWPLEEARMWLPFDLPVAGPSFGRVHLEGAADDPAGSVQLEVRAGELFEIPVETLRAELQFDPEKVGFETPPATTAPGK
jgi:hypothetical protein